MKQVAQRPLTPRVPSGGGGALAEGASPQGGGGEVDLREYVVALSVVCRPARTLDTIQLAFKASAALLRL